MVPRFLSAPLGLQTLCLALLTRSTPDPLGHWAPRDKVWGPSVLPAAVMEE